MPHQARVAARVFWAALGKVRYAFLAFAVVLSGGTVLFWLTGIYANPILSFYHSLNLVTLNTGPADLQSRPLLLQAAALVITLTGVLALAGGAASILQLITDPKERQLALASTFHDHIVVCGIGRVGYRVINELLLFGESVVGINESESEEWLEPLKRAGVPVIIGDGRRKQTLIDGGVERASALVVCTSNDLANLDMALDARELNPSIKIVLRMFDQKLAQHVSKGFGIQTAFSVSALAAPAFAAAATRARVNYSFKLEGQLLNVSTITFQPVSRFVGQTIAHIEQEAQCTIIGAHDDSGSGLRLNPRPEHVVAAGERFYIVGSLEALKILNNGA